MRGFLLSLALASLAVAAPARASDFTPAQILSAVNAERRANALPAALTEDAGRTNGCYLHDQYGVLNGGFDAANPHGETATKPGYTTAGAQAGAGSVLSTGGAWSSGNPWEYAPWHFLDIMGPRLALSGADEHGGFDCLWVADRSGPAPAADAIYGALPGGHDAAVWWEQVQNEWPSSPGDLVGFPEGGPSRPGAITGPDIAVYWAGPGADTLDELTAATVTGPTGAVPISIINNQMSNLVPPASGIVLPHDTLLPDTAYTVSATFASSSDASQSYTGAFSFHTVPKIEADRLVHIGDLVPSGSRASLDVTFEPLLQHRAGTITVSSNYGPAGSPSGGTLIDTTFSFSPPGAGQWLKVTVSTSAFSIGSTTYDAKTVTRIFAGPPGTSPGRTTTTTGPSGSARDITPPAVGLSGPLGLRLHALLASEVPTRVSCSERCHIAAGLSLDRRTAKRFRTRPVVGRASASLAAAGSARLVVRLSRTARAALRRARPPARGVVLSLRLVVEDKAGNVAPAIVRHVVVRR